MLQIIQPIIVLAVQEMVYVITCLPWVIYSALILDAQYSFRINVSMLVAFIFHYKHSFVEK